MGLSGSFLNRTKLAPPSRFLCNFHPASTDVRADNRAPIVRLEGILTRCSPERTSSKEMRLYPSRRSSNKSPTCLLACNNDFTHQSTGKSLPCSSVCPTIRQLDENKKQAIESIETDRGRGGEGSGERNNWLPNYKMGDEQKDTEGTNIERTQNNNSTNVHEKNINVTKKKKKNERKRIRIGVFRKGQTTMQTWQS